jgi:hypothetical protein
MDSGIGASRRIRQYTPITGGVCSIRAHEERERMAMMNSLLARSGSQSAKWQHGAHARAFEGVSAAMRSYRTFGALHGFLGRRRGVFESGSQFTANPNAVQRSPRRCQHRLVVTRFPASPIESRPGLAARRSTDVVTE